MEIMILSFLGPAVACDASFDITSEQESLISTVVFIGMFFGANAWGSVADTYGRKTCIMGSSLTVGISGLLSSFAPNLWLLLVLRVITGFGIGGIPVLLSVFLEIVPTSSRGMWGSLIQGFWAVGTLFQCLLAYLTLRSLGWRWLLGLSSIPLFILAAGFYFAHESPRWLLAKGREQEAHAILVSIARQNGAKEAERTLQTCRLKSMSMQEAADGVDPHGVGTLEAAGANAPMDEDESNVGLGGRGVMSAEAIGARASGIGLEMAPGDSEEDVFGLGQRRDTALDECDRDALHGSASTSGSWAEYAWDSMCGDRSFLAALVEVLSPPYTVITLVLWLVWITNAFTYYGLVLLATQVAVNDNGGCPDDGGVPLED